MAFKTTHYRGFSSFEFPTSGSFSLTDIELVKLDLLNHIYTRRGERIMMPNYGTLIPELTFEPLDQELIDRIIDELETVFEMDPRVEQMSINVTPMVDNNALIVSAELLYIEFGVTDSLEFNVAVGNDV